MTVSMSDVTTLHQNQFENINAPVFNENTTQENGSKNYSNSTNLAVLNLPELPKIQEIVAFSQLDEVIDEIYREFCDDLIYGIVLQIHRASKLGYLFYLQPETTTDDSKFQIFEENDVIGVFSHLNSESNFSSKGQAGRSGNSSTSTNNNNNHNMINKFECVCPSCDRNVAAIRFAPHLEKCMGMGRNSSRIATRRIANYAGDDLDQLIESTGYIQNYSTNSYSNGNSNKNQTLPIVPPVPTHSTVLSNSQNPGESQSTVSQKTLSGQDDLMSIINSVATASNKQGVNDSNGSMIKAPSAKKMKTKKVTGPSATPVADSSNNVWQDTMSQEAELVKISGSEFTTVPYSTVSISPSPNSSSSISSGSTVLSSATTSTQCPNFVEPIFDHSRSITPSNFVDPAISSQIDPAISSSLSYTDNTNNHFNQ